MPGTQVPEKWNADPDKLYNLRTFLSMNWPYDEQGRLKGEHVYQHSSITELKEVPPEEFITLEEARAKLMPLQQELPELAWRSDEVLR